MDTATRAALPFGGFVSFEAALASFLVKLGELINSTNGPITTVEASPGGKEAAKLADIELAKAAGKPTRYNHVIRNCNVAQTATQARNFDAIMAHAGAVLRAKGKNPRKGAILDYALSFYPY